MTAPGENTAAWYRAYAGWWALLRPDQQRAMRWLYHRTGDKPTHAVLAELVGLGLATWRPLPAAIVLTVPGLHLLRMVEEAP